MDGVIFLKLGGSLITDKTGVEEVRQDVLKRLAGEIRQARKTNPGMKLVLGHGSGSFGHVAGAQYGTRQGVSSAEEWGGFVAVSAAASRLNEIVIAALLDAGLPALSLQPSASAVCRDGQIVELAVRPVEMALAAGLLPVVFGDVAFDTQRGGTIISTEEVMAHLAGILHPSWFLLAGETPGVLDSHGQVLPLITEDTYPEVLPALGGSRGTDVTGGMVTKVRGMLDLAVLHDDMRMLIFSGIKHGSLLDALVSPNTAVGTVIYVDKRAI